MISLLMISTIAGLCTGHVLRDPDRQPLLRERDYCPVFYKEPPTDCDPLPNAFVDYHRDDFDPPLAGPEVLEDAFEAFEVLQDEFFDADFGTWPSAIDWTGAVIETVVSGTLTTLTKSLNNVTDQEDVDGWKAKENLLSSYFAEVVNSYYGQDILSLRGEAFDDMLWVVLGWTEAVKFVREHAKRHYLRDETLGISTSHSRLHKALQNKPWHGEKWVPAFAHRARIFWNLASRGWDTTFCRGGMVWDRRRSPYKNAITNELWISASIAMYQYYPGDNITSPWTIDDRYREKDPAHLAAAVEGYKWLMGVGMINRLGLFVDGYHISSRGGNTRCDLRDEMVYTYNQGVLLTGHRGLWHVTGSASYLEDGHDLIQSVINATGWSLERRAPIDMLDAQARRLPIWRGLGRGGIMEERCDASGTCSQDGQAFKGIFFHHLTAFCAPLDPITVAPDVTLDVEGFQRVQTAHSEACDHYLGWVRHNALAAMGTRDPDGVFGMWWGAGMFGEVAISENNDGIDHWAPNTTDYRNEGTPANEIWGRTNRYLPGDNSHDQSRGDGLLAAAKEQLVMQPRPWSSKKEARQARGQTGPQRDPNQRGRGRSVETQMSGLALLRAYWELSQVVDMA